MTASDSGPAGTKSENPEEEGPIGPFSSWNALYTTVIIYAFVLIVIFYVLSSLLDFSGS